MLLKLLRETSAGFISDDGLVYPATLEMFKPSKLERLKLPGYLARSYPVNTVEPDPISLLAFYCAGFTLLDGYLTCELCPLGGSRGRLLRQRLAISGAGKFTLVGVGPVDPITGRVILEYTPLKVVLV